MQSSSITRRNLLKKLSAISAGTLIIPTALTSCQTEDSRQTEQGQPRFFSENQYMLVEELSELIIPTTNTPGAISAEVHVYIESIVEDCFTKEEQELFLKGLSDFETAVQEGQSKAWSDLDEGGKTAFLTTFDNAVFDAREAEGFTQDDLSDAQLFWLSIKRLTVTGYFTSKIGATKNLDYIPVPGRYEPCITVDPKTAKAVIA